MLDSNREKFLFSGNNKTISVVGGIPAPIGGVTSYIKRLVDRYADKIDAVIDLYPEKDKKKIPVKHLVLNRIPVVKLFFYILFFYRKSYYFNFSTTKSLIVFFAFPRFIINDWSLTLHNGSLRQFETNLSFLNIFLKSSLKKFKRIGYLSETQRKFYVEMGVPICRLYKISSFVPVNWDRIPEARNIKLCKFNKFIDSGERVFIVSGYPTAIYQHLEVMNIFIELNKKHNRCCLVLFLYGEDSDGLLESIEKLVRRYDFFAMYWKKDETTFLAALRASSGYIRMNIVDSFGIAVADAVTAGVPVIASDVCERFSGAELVSPNDIFKINDFVCNGFF